MRKIIISLLLLMPSCVFSQPKVQDDSSIHKIIEAAGRTKDDLYLTANVWFVKTFVSSNEVIQLQDKQNGMLIGKGTIEYKAPAFNPGTLYSGFFHFTFSFECKDGKYKYDIEDIYYQATQNPPEMVFGKKKLAKTYQKITNVENEEIAQLAQDFEQGMNKSTKKDNW